jgi:pilus assembly protein CpaD
MKLEHLFRALAVGSVLMAGSCSVANDGNTISLDGARNHPIAVEPSYRDLKLQYSGGADGLSREEAAKFDAFVADYRVRGNGSLGISVPSGAGSRAAITFFGERAAASGISRDKILVTVREAGNADPRVDVSYIAYVARAQPCGNWSEDEAFTQENHTSANFGCSVQHNIAAMVADPRDLLGPGAMGPVSTNRRAVVMDHYEKGEITQANKATDQQAEVSNVSGGR